MKGKWSSYLPHDLLLLIANGLGLIDFLSFRGVCKDWRVASSKISSRDESLGCDPWFLTYESEEGSLCSLLSHHDKLYTMNIPELAGATCLASYEGWLLIFGNGSLFFFCPFSKAKINLPNCPFTRITEHVAAFSSAPTSQDCIVVVVNRCNKQELELFILCRGEQLWSTHSFHSVHARGFNTIRTAFFYRKKGEFHFLDGDDVMVTFDVSENKRWNKCYYRLVPHSTISDKLLTVHYSSRVNPFQLLYKKRKEEFIEANISISTRGTIIPRAVGNNIDLVFQSESIDAAEGSGSRHLKGVWIQPRYMYVPPGQTW